MHHYTMSYLPNRILRAFLLDTSDEEMMLRKMSSYERLVYVCVGASVSLLALALLMIIMLPPRAHAHDHDRPDLTEWYQTLKGKGLCCDGSQTEVRHLSEVQWRTSDGHYQVYINQFMDNSGEFMWVDVPDDAVIKEPNKDGRPTVWPIWGIKPNVRCFMPGMLS
jgi:hypothetical protein